MLKIPRHPMYDEWSTHSYGVDCFPCVICGKAIKNTKVKHRIHMANDGENLLSIEEAEKDKEAWNEMGQWPIGTDCLRQHPELKEYTIQTS